MALQLYDTLQRKKVAFTPRPKGPVTLYVCGPTVYDYAHIGNARPVVVFDVLYRLLRRLHPDREVIYARNVTDIDDKIIARAAEAAEPIFALTDRYAKVYAQDMAALNALPPTLTPFATQHVAAMVGQIERLVAADAAYVADGHVLFRVGAFPAYGALSNRLVEDMRAGARVEVAGYKRDAADFVLWKPAKPGEPAFDSPWGRGRPGWHIECSAMIEQVLGLPVDIHGGGHDLIFPHHTNEIAQGCCAVGASDPAAYARYWMHNGFLTMDAEKMSKSLGNVQTVHGLLERWPGEVLRWALLSAHYRAPLDWTDALLEQSRKALDRLYGVLQDASRLAGKRLSASGAGVEGVTAALLDDLATPAALADLFALGDSLRAAVTRGDVEGAEAEAAKLLSAASLIGFLAADPDAWFSGEADDGLKAQVEALLAERAAARAAKDWAQADRLRDRLAALNVEVLDGAKGAVSWRLKG